MAIAKAMTCAAPGLMTKWRETRGVTQTAAATMVGVRQATWSDWENGKKRPHIPQALKIAEVTLGDVPVEAWAESATSNTAA